MSAAQPLGAQTFPLLSVPQQGASLGGTQSAGEGRADEAEHARADQRHVARLGGSDVWRVNGCGRSSSRSALRVIALVATPDVLAQRGRGGPSTAGFVRRTLASPASGSWSPRKLADPNGQVVPGPNAASGGRFGFITYDPAGYVGVTIAWIEAAGVQGQGLDTGRSAVGADLVQLVLGIVRGERSPRHVTHQTFGAVSPSFAGHQSGARVHDCRQPADAAAAQPVPTGISGR